LLTDVSQTDLLSTKALLPDTCGYLSGCRQQHDRDGRRASDTLSGESHIPLAPLPSSLYSAYDPKVWDSFELVSAFDVTVLWRVSSLTLFRPLLTLLSPLPHY
jgi:hypothetical protein